MTYINHFNQGSDKYIRFRPDYPEALFTYLLSLLNKTAQVWDCGTGNGQAAVSLAKQFKRILATDINLQPLEMASHKSNVHYICCSAEKTPFLDHTIDLVTVAQALHWFNLENFYKEVRRVAKPSSIIAAWCYSLGMINVDVDPLINMLYTDILGDKYWPTERRYIDTYYQTISFPFVTIEAPSFTIEKKIDFFSLIGYLNTWSAVKEYQKRQHANPIDLIYEKLLFAWGEPQKERMMRWPVHMLVGRID